MFKRKDIRNSNCSLTYFFSYKHILNSCTTSSFPFFYFYFLLFTFCAYQFIRIGLWQRKMLHPQNIRNNFTTNLRWQTSISGQKSNFYDGSKLELAIACHLEFIVKFLWNFVYVASLTGKLITTKDIFNPITRINYILTPKLYLLLHLPTKIYNLLLLSS